VLTLVLWRMANQMLSHQYIYHIIIRQTPMANDNFYNAKIDLQSIKNGFRMIGRRLEVVPA
jgi:hypothetical protein